jgi:hypothetical protein
MYHKTVCANRREFSGWLRVCEERVCAAIKWKCYGYCIYVFAFSYHIKAIAECCTRRIMNIDVEIKSGGMQEENGTLI